MTLLKVGELTIRYRGSPEPVVSDLSFSIGKGESVGLVGESGAGKTQTALAIMGLLPGNARATGSIVCTNQEIVGASESELAKIRARHIAMIFQNPDSALNPYLRVGEQLRQIVVQHRLAAGAEINERVVAMLARTGLPDPERQFRAYPHQLSGGMRQRVMIASALMAEPDLLIADEPTTALDATVQTQILSLLRTLQQETDTTLLLITHDLGVVAATCERMLVLDQGRLVEEGSTHAVFANPREPSTQAMMKLAGSSQTRVAIVPDTESPATLTVTDLAVTYTEHGADGLWSKTEIPAVKGMNMSVRPGETVAIVGESGAGKTSMARAILGLVEASSGKVCCFGKALSARLEDRSIKERRKLQLVFQDPLGSLNPAMRVRSAVAETLRVHEPDLSREERNRRVGRMFDAVGLDRALLERHPHELSGGQAQRVAIARALIIRPALLICDEAVASLDGSSRAGILRVLLEEQQRSGLSILFISHDLDIVRQISHRVFVMYMGRVFETASSEALFARPRHPYSRALIDCIPVPDPGVPPMDPPVIGEAPSMIRPPSGCVFHPRCRHAIDRCGKEVPFVSVVGRGRVACHRAEELDLSF